MKPTSTVLITAGAIAVSVFTFVAHANNSSGSAPQNEPLSAEARIERGRLLVHRVVLCIDCHSPRNERGEHIESQHLMGAPVLFQPTVPMPWAPFAPPLAGIPADYTATEAQFEHFLMTGERPHGLPAPRPPMPRFMALRHR